MHAGVPLCADLGGCEVSPIPFKDRNVQKSNTVEPNKGSRWRFPASLGRRREVQGVGSRHDPRQEPARLHGPRGTCFKFTHSLHPFARAMAERKRASSPTTSGQGQPAAAQQPQEEGGWSKFASAAQKCALHRWTLSRSPVRSGRSCFTWHCSCL